MRTVRQGSSPIQLNIELDGFFLLAMVEQFGVEHWNLWIESMTMGGFMPLCWSPDEPIPPCWYWMNFSNSDFSKRNWEGLNIALPYFENCDFDGSLLSGARIGCCPLSSFRGSDLSGAEFRGDITAVDFNDSDVRGIQLRFATYNEQLPPLGLPDELLRVCKAEPSEPTSGTGTDEIPVVISGSLTALRMPE